MLTENEAEEIRIRRVVENWALFRDAGRWDAFATLWHDDGWMTATWFQGPATDFITASRKAFDAGVNILHFLGGFTCEVRGERAIAQTKMTIQQRAPVHGILADATCTGRFYDFMPAGPRSSDPSWQGAKLAVTYHPAFLLRDPRQKGEAWKDLQMVMKYLGLKPPEKIVQ